MSRKIRFVIDENPPSRLDKALARDVPEDAALSRSRLVRLLDEGKIEVAGQIARDPKARVAAGEEVIVTVDAAQESHILPEEIPLDIVYEDDALVVVNKPAGMVVHPAPGTPSGTLVNALLGHFGTDLSGVGGMKRPGIVHRIDKDTTGLLVVAKSDAAHHGLAAQFEAHTVSRLYTALVHGVPDAADPRLRGVRGVSFEAGNIVKITTQIARHRTDRQRQAVLFEGGRHAVTRARATETFGDPPNLALMECWLETGRTHQIRVHMTHAGHALVGDQTYGGRRRISAKALPEAAINAVTSFPRQALHAARLGFLHPVTGADVHFDAPLPSDMAELVACLRVL